MTVPVTTLIETYEELRDEWKTTHCGDESEESRSAIAMAVLMAAQNQEAYESPPIVPTAIWQERTGSPSTWTVQAPH
jgi:hypothetical protein